MAKNPQHDAKKQAEKLEKLRQFVRENKGLHHLNVLSDPEAVEKALKQATPPQDKKKP